ncbi:MAG: 30S ribosomal protein S7 [Deltaproteobacteria bacterium]|nr:30S ribosomal protein S7 [Deltaproteobacteria bacterium]|tara:strand:+ start:31 stop:501 length:471 start_codon:yes stop_codon:yes gene_type:complete
MPRRREVPKRKIHPDPLYKDVLVTKFMNCVMLDGKKSTAESIVYGAFEVIHERTREEPLKIFHRALENVQPMVEVKSRRVGGATYQVPVEVGAGRKMALSMRWLIQFARKRSGKSMKDKLANELIEAAHQRGSAVKKRDDVHRMAEANKAFSHYRW